MVRPLHRQRIPSRTVAGEEKGLANRWPLRKVHTSVRRLHSFTWMVDVNAWRGWTQKTLEVKALLPSERFVIAFHSPSGLVETGLRICPPEKMARRFAYGSSARHFLQSGFGVRIAKLRRFRAILRGMQLVFSALQTEWRSEMNSNSRSLFDRCPLRAA